MDFFKLGKIGAKAHWLQYHKPVRKHISKNYSLLKKEKARLIGFIMGDGSIDRLKYPINPANQHYDISFYPDSLEVAKIFIADFKKLYLKEPIIRQRNNYYSLRVSSKPACDDLRSFGEYTSLKWKFPNKLKTKEEKIEWLKAIFDCESCVGKKNIQFQSVSKIGIESIKKLLEELGILSNIYKYARKNKRWNDNYILIISRKENIKRYAELIGFNHPVKQQKLTKLAGVPERLMGESRKLVSARTPRFES